MEAVDAAKTVLILFIIALSAVLRLLVSVTPAAFATIRFDSGLMFAIPGSLANEYIEGLLVSFGVALSRYGACIPVTSILYDPSALIVAGVWLVLPAASLAVTVPTIGAPLAATPETVLADGVAAPLPESLQPVMNPNRAVTVATKKYCNLIFFMF